MIESPSASIGPGGELGSSAAGVGAAESDSALRSRDPGGRELCVQLFGELRALVGLVGQLDEPGLDLGARAAGAARRDRSGFDSDRCAQAARPSRSYRGVCGLRAIAQISPQRDP